MKSQNLLNRLKSLGFIAFWYEDQTWQFHGPSKDGGTLNFWLTLGFDCDSFVLVERLTAYYTPKGHKTSSRRWNIDFNDDLDSQLDNILEFKYL